MRRAIPLQAMMREKRKIFFQTQWFMETVPVNRSFTKYAKASLRPCETAGFFLGLSFFGKN